MNPIHIEYEDGSRRIIRVNNSFLYSSNGKHRLDERQLHKKVMNTAKQYGDFKTSELKVFDEKEEKQ